MTSGSQLALLQTAAGLLAGPLVLAGFFLPWAHGPRVLAATEFSGFKLVQFAGRLRVLDLAPAVDGAVLSIRVLILGVAIAATWLTLLAPRHRWHFGYRLSGLYIVATAAIALVIGLLKSGIEAPPLGFALWCTGAALFLVAEYGAARAGPGPSPSPR